MLCSYSASVIVFIDECEGLVGPVLSGREGVGGTDSFFYVIPRTAGSRL